MSNEQHNSQQLKQTRLLLISCILSSHNRTMNPLIFVLVIVAFSLCNGLSISSIGANNNRPAIKSVSSRPSAARPTFSSSRSTVISAASVSGGGGGYNSTSIYDKVDWAALIKYPVAVAVQLSLMFGFFTGIDKIVAHYSLKVPFALNFVFLYAFNLKSSLFSIMPNKKSDGRKLTQENWEYNQRKQPSWTPPGIAFVIGWPLLTFGLRAFTGAMVVKATPGGKYATAAIMSLMLHLSTGNLWNTVNNVERRLGTSVVLLYGMWLTKAFAAFQFYKVEPLAGKLLAVTLTWITAACALLTRSWQINPDSDTGKREPLVPRQHPKWTTHFRWEE